MPAFRRTNERAARYRQKAIVCEQAAHSIKDPKTKALHLDLAKEWQNLARQAEILDCEREDE